MKINDIINEEHEKLVNEAYTMQHENFMFRQEIKPPTESESEIRFQPTAEFYNFQNFSNDFDVEIDNYEIVINWAIGFSLDEAGVEVFYVQGNSVEGTYEVVLRDKQTDEESQKTDKNIADIPWKFQIIDAKLHLHKSLYVYSVTFDFQTKICNIVFFDPDN